MRLEYRSGGNPPVNPGVFVITGKNTARRVAFWPAGYGPSEERLDIAYRLILMREDDAEILSRDVLREAFDKKRNP